MIVSNLQGNEKKAINMLNLKFDLEGCVRVGEIEFFREFLK